MPVVYRCHVHARVCNTCLHEPLYDLSFPSLSAACHKRNWVIRVTLDSRRPGRRPTGMGCAVAGARARAGFAVSFSSLSCLPVSTQKGNRACETPVTLCVDWGSGERGQRQGGPGTCWWPHLHQLPGCRGEAPVVLELCPGNAHPRHLLFCLLSSLGLGVSLLCDCSCSASSWHKFAEPAPSFH